MAVILDYFCNPFHSHKRLIYTVAGAAIAYTCYRNLNVFQEKYFMWFEAQVIEKNWKKDTVYLYQSPRTEYLPNHSPFALKLEALMKLYSIPYEIRTVNFVSFHNGPPFVELNGQRINRIRLIDVRIQEHFKVPNLSPEEEAITRPICLMLETNTYPIMLKNKLLDHPENLVLIADALDWPDSVRAACEEISINAFRHMATLLVRTMLGGMLSDADFTYFLKKDLRVLNTVLGEKKFILGDKITQPDCTVFAQLATLYYLPTENDTKQLITTEFPALGRYVDRVRAHIFGENF